MNPTVSVIILNYNGIKSLGKTLLGDCLSSVLESDYDDFELIFYDNGSVDKSLEFVKEKFGQNSRLKIIVGSKNSGFAQGNNLAFAHTRGNYIVLLNNDAVVEPNWIKELIKVMEADLTIGIAQSKIVSFDRIRIQTAGDLVDPSLGVYLMGLEVIDNGQYDKMSEITFACGAALITRRSLIKKIGLFDPDYFWYHDDVDFGWRARLIGLKIVYVPSSVVYHKGSGTSVHAFKGGQELLFFLMSSFGLFVKNYEWKSILKHGTKFCVRLSTDLFGLTLKGDLKTPLKFATWALGSFRDNWAKRLIVQKQIRKVKDDEVLKVFLSSYLLVLRFEKFFNKLVGGKIRKDFDKLTDQALYDYYKHHSFEL